MARRISWSRSRRGIETLSGRKVTDFCRDLNHPAPPGYRMCGSDPKNFGTKEWIRYEPKKALSYWNSERDADPFAAGSRPGASTAGTAGGTGGDGGQSRP